MTNDVSNFAAELSARISFIKPRVKLSIPFAPQFISTPLIEDFLSGNRDVRSDRLWRKSGASTKDEYELWTRNGCGMACLQMILLYKKKLNIPLVTLGKICEKYGGYKKNGNTYDGLFYAPFCHFIKQEFDLSGAVAPLLSLRRIQYELSNNNIVIASVDPNIRDINNPSKTRGGHLVVITGYDLTKKTVSLHNPSGLYNKSQIHHSISESDFNRFFAHRGIIIHFSA